MCARQQNANLNSPLKRRHYSLIDTNTFSFKYVLISLIRAWPLCCKEIGITLSDCQKTERNVAFNPTVVIHLYCKILNHLSSAWISRSGVQFICKAAHTKCACGVVYVNRACELWEGQWKSPQETTAQSTEADKSLSYCSCITRGAASRLEPPVNALQMRGMLAEIFTQKRADMRKWIHVQTYTFEFSSCGFSQSDFA